MIRALAIVLCVFAARPAFASAEGQKRAARRGEAERAVVTILDGGSVEGAVSRLQYIGEERYAAEALVGALQNSFEDQGRRSIAQALALLHVRSTEGAMLRLSADDDAVVRMYAAQGLGRVKSRQAKVLVALLSDKSMPVRREAAKALGAMHQPSLGKLLMKVARTEGEPEVRAELLVAVGLSGDKKQAKELEPFLKNSSESTRFAAARGLCGLGSPVGFAFARGLLSAEDKYERRQGLELFEGFPAKIIEKEVRPLLKDADRAMAARAARILYEGGDDSMLDWLVLASHQASGSEKLAIEDELEKLHLADDQRKAILARNGVP